MILIKDMNYVNEQAIYSSCKSKMSLKLNTNMCFPIKYESTPNKLRSIEMKTECTRTFLTKYILSFYFQLGLPKTTNYQLHRPLYKASIYILIFE